MRQYCGAARTLFTMMRRGVTLGPPSFLEKPETTMLCPDWLRAWLIYHVDHREPAVKGWFARKGGLSPFLKATERVLVFCVGTI